MSFKFPWSLTDDQIQKIRTLRRLTNLTLVPCKEALLKTNWNVEEALKLLSEEEVRVVFRGSST